MVLVLIIIPVYKQLITKKQLISENDTNIIRRRKIKGSVSPASKNDFDSTNCTPKQNPCTHYHKILTIETIAAMRDDTTEIKHNIIANITDTLQDEKQFAVNRTDSILVKDSIIAPNLYKESWITENIEVHKRNKWQLLAAGSLGTTLVQSVCKFMKSNDITNDLPSGPDQPTDPINPAEKYFTTWEDYAKELHRISQTDPTTENVAMADIADHNSGEIVEVEHHDKPITLSIAVNKNIGKRWSLETGLQYSYLKSYLILGTGSYRVDKEQKLHYLGVPFKLSYQFMKFKRLSTYGSVGTGILIPIYGKTDADYIVGDKSAYTTDWKLTLPIQWSVNTNIGIQYQFAPNLNLFIEPTMNWYIPNGSCIKNVWTERPFTFTVPFGIRFSW